MLVLTRRIGEEIVIAGNIRIMVVATNGQRVRLGFTAPLSISVARSELLDDDAAHALPFVATVRPDNEK